MDKLTNLSIIGDIFWLDINGVGKKQGTSPVLTNGMFCSAFTNMVGNDLEQTGRRRPWKGTWFQESLIVVTAALFGPEHDHKRLLGDMDIDLLVTN